jgi:two-component sensor histidine kinase
MSVWNFISSSGIQDHYDDKLVKRIRLTNQFACVAFTVFMLSGINNYFLGDAFSALIIEFFAVCAIAVVLLNKIHIHQFPISFLLVMCSIAVFYFDSYSGLASGSYLFYFPLILAIAFLFDLKEKKSILLHFVFCLSLLAINLFTKHTLFKNNILSDAVKESMFAFNLLFSAASIGFFMYLTISNNIREGNVYEQRINERKASELAIKTALNEKDVLLAEIHHRVKNNLAIIASLFNLQLISIENEEAKAILTDSKNRVKSMALIHDSLYRSEQLSEINFGKYTQELVNEIQYSYPTIAKNVTVNTFIEKEVHLTVNNAIPCGLILNELLTNSYKHAFVGREKGVIDIHFTKKNSIVKLAVKDDGVGLKDGYKESDSLGMVVIHSLADQLDGHCTFTVNNGTLFEFTFEQV